jgi:putative SOS response-associated peptidase YedK
MQHGAEVARTPMKRAERAGAQLDLGLNSGPDIDLEDQVKGQRGLVVRWNPTTGERQLDELVWGLLPHGTKNPATAPRPINARAETVADHPMFASAFQYRRAIVPATVYYQRRTKGGSRQSFAISRTDRRPMAFAGLWESFDWPNGEITRTYCVITTAANSMVAPIHHRMPVVLEEEDWPVWLGEKPGNVMALLHAPPADMLQCQPVRGKAGTARDNRRDAANVAATLTF